MGLRGVLKFFAIRAVEGMVAILLITFMPNLPPDAKYSQTYSLTPVVPFEGSLTLNNKLQTAEKWHKGDFNGPEAFAVYNGELYTTIHGGNVVKLIGEDIVPVVKFGKDCKGFYQEHICGRPLGMQFDKHGGLYVADAYYGIFKVDIKTGKQIQLVSMDQEINGKKPKLPNSVSVADNGDVYWTDSSTEFFLYDGVFDMLADGSGRLIHYNAKTKENTVLIDKLHFSNGVKLAADESFVITTETARCRVYRYHLKGPKKGTYDVFLDGLPGLPDNIQTDGKDGFLISLVVGRDDDYPPPLNIMGQFPLLRKFLSRVLGLTELGFKVLDQIYPSEWAQKAIHYVGHFESLPHSFDSPRQTIMHVSKDGTILDSVHSLNGSIIGICEAFILKDILYMGSPFNNYIGRIPLKQIGWDHLAMKESDYPSSIPTLKVAPEPKNIPSPTQPTPKVAPTRPTTSTSQHTTSLPPTTETTLPPPPPVKETPGKHSSPSATETTPPPPPSKQTTQPPPPTKQTTPPPTPAKQTTQPPPPPPTKQTTAPPPPTKQTTQPPPPPSPKQTTTPPPPPAKQSTQPPPPPPTKQTTPPPTSAKQTTQPPPPSPPATKQTTAPPSPAKQTTQPSTKERTTPSPPTMKETTTPPPPPAKETTPPPPPAKHTTQPPKEAIPSPAKQIPSSQPSAKETAPPAPAKHTELPASTKPPTAATPKQAPPSKQEMKNEL